MATERKWASVPPTPFTANGTAKGVITLADTAGFKTKQAVFLKSNTQPFLELQVKRVLSKTVLIVGPNDNRIATWTPSDISAYTTADAATIGAAEQDKNNIPEKDHYAAVYESDPTVADRTVDVDKYGNFYDSANPKPVNLFPPTQVPFTFGLLGLPVYVTDMLGSSFYDTVISETSGTTETLTFYDNGSVVNTIIFTKEPGGWMINVIPPANGFIQLEAGGYLLQENTSHLII